MKILYVTNMYPNKRFTYMGIHVKEQIDCLTNNFDLDHELIFIDGNTSRMNYFKSVFTINFLIIKERFDIVHIHFGLSGLFVLFNPFIKIPIIVTLHGDDINSNRIGGLMKLVTKLVVRRARKTIVLNDQMISVLKSNKKKLIKIPCGINVKQFKVLRNNVNERFVIGFPGDRMRNEKNFSFFEKITNQLITEGSDLKIVEFHNLTRSQVAEKLSELDCLMMTSIREGSPQIIKQAMASNVPIISSNVGDVSYLLEGVENCFVINDFVCQSFVSTVKKIIELPKKDRKSNGLDKLLKLGLDDESISQKIYDLYTEIV